MSWLRAVPLLKGVGQPLIDLLEGSICGYSQGHTIIAQGQEPTCALIIRSGAGGRAEFRVNVRSGVVR